MSTFPATQVSKVVSVVLRFRQQITRLSPAWLSSILLLSCGANKAITIADAATSSFYDRLSRREYALIYADSLLSKKGENPEEAKKWLDKLTSTFGSCKLDGIPKRHVDIRIEYTSVEMECALSCQNGRRVDDLEWRIADGKCLLARWLVHPLVDTNDQNVKKMQP